MSSAARETFTSEHTANARSSSRVWADHSRSVCDNSEIDGTANRTRAEPPFSVARRSAIFNAVNVLPVPHAMISFPRSFPAANPVNTFSMAWA